MDLAAAAVLHYIHPRVGRADDRVDSDAVGGAGRQANARADAQMNAGAHVEAGFEQLAVQRRDERLRQRSTGSGHEDDELVAAVAEAAVLLAAQLAQSLSGARQQLAADQ